MLGELKRYLRDSRWCVRVPRELQERALEVGSWSAELTGALGRAPAAEDVAEASGYSVVEVEEAVGAFGSLHIRSLDADLDAHENGDTNHHDLLGATDPGYARVEEAASVEPGLAALSRQERKVLHLRFVEDLTQNQIGQRLGVSQIQVSRLIRRAVVRVREESGLTQAA
jgi:RNA polymerase sigma-B factor